MGLRRQRRRSVSARKPLRSLSSWPPRSSLLPPRRTGVARRATRCRTGLLMVSLLLPPQLLLPSPLLPLQLLLFQHLPSLLSRLLTTGQHRLRTATGQLSPVKPTPGEDPTSGSGQQLLRCVWNKFP